MQKELENYILTRCERKLSEDADYMNIQRLMKDAYRNNDLEHYSELSYKMQLIVEQISYKTAAHDLCELITC